MRLSACCSILLGVTIQSSWAWSTRTSALAAAAQPFGRQDYWQGVYEQQTSDFSWYAAWPELEPFIVEWVSQDHDILLPGVGCDALLKDLWNAGYTELAAFDYAPRSIEYCQSTMLLPEEANVQLVVADARDLSCYESASFDAVLDKGTLDAIFLAGDTAAQRLNNLQRSISELQRVLRPGGIFWSLSGICADGLRKLNDECWMKPVPWQVLTDGSLYTTRDGYTSNNIDGTLMVWRKPTIYLKSSPE